MQAVVNAASLQPICSLGGASIDLALFLTQTPKNVIIYTKTVVISGTCNLTHTHYLRINTINKSLIFQWVSHLSNILLISRHFSSHVRVCSAT